MGSKESLSFKKFEIFSNEDASKSVDLRAGTPRIEYRESIFLPYVLVSASIVDTGNAVPDGDDFVSVLEGVKCQGLERVDFSIEDSSGNRIELSGENSLRLAETSDINSSFKSNVFIIKMVSKEAFDNFILENRCRQLYSGTIADVVRVVVERNLRSNKNTQNFDQTSNTIDEWGKDRTPFDIILFLQKLGIPASLQNSRGESAEGKMAGYLFWQTSEGFCFKSLDNLFKTTGSYLRYSDSRGRRIKNYIENKKSDNVIPVGFDDKILHFTTNRTINALNQFETGAYGTVLETWDPIESSYSKNEAFTSSGEGNGIPAGQNLPNFGSEYTDIATVRLSEPKPKGQRFSSGDTIDQQLTKTDQENYNVEQIIQQSMQNYKQKMNMSAEITIAVDLSLHAGDLVYCEFQELSTKRTVRRSTNRDSGIYMIADLCHFGSGTKSYTKLHLVRDSYGVKTNG